MSKENNAREFLEEAQSHRYHGQELPGPKKALELLTEAEGVLIACDDIDAEVGILISGLPLGAHSHEVFDKYPQGLPLESQKRLLDKLYKLSSLIEPFRRKSGERALPFDLPTGDIKVILGRIESNGGVIAPGELSPISSTANEYKKLFINYLEFLRDAASQG